MAWHGGHMTPRDPKARAPLERINAITATSGGVAPESDARVRGSASLAAPRPIAVRVVAAHGTSVMWI
jgi:hypothetical protein